MARFSRRRFSSFFYRFLSSFKEWIVRNLIIFINSVVTVVLILIVIFILLTRVSNLQRESAEEAVVNLAEQTATEIQSYFLAYYNILRTTAQVMRSYRNIEIDQRRNFINDTMLEIISANRTFINVYSVWKPNVLDGRDASYANAPGSNEIGQFISGYTRVQGWIEQRTFAEHLYTLDLDYRAMGLTSGVISEPFPMFSGRYLNSWVVDLQFPIIVDDDVLGLVGITMDLEVLQYLVGNTTLLDYNLRTMVSSDRGTLVAHSNLEMRGSSFAGDTVFQYELEPLLDNDVRSTMYSNIRDSIIFVTPVTARAKDSLVVSFPLRWLDPNTGVYVSLSGHPRWAVITVVPLEIVLAPIYSMYQFSFFFIIGAAVLMAFVVLGTSRTLTQRTKSLQRDLEQASTMQDNLKFGLFLMDNKWIVQRAYSKALEKILSVSNLSGKNFVELLTSSIKAVEKDGLADYFEMFFNRSFDPELLSSINPIIELDYVSIDTGERKNLRTNFIRAERGRSEFILGTVEDITAEKALQKQLLEAENLRENEMRSLFQVIQIDPRVLSDFVADAEYEFERINELLKNKRELHKELLVDMFQSVHAVKSNAVILNLESFSDRLHKLEASVRNLQEYPADILPFDDFLGLFLEIDDAMKEIDQLKETVSRIENFRSVSRTGKAQEQYVLVETLSRVCDKTQTALNKKVKFVVEEIDPVVMNYGPRREIKEILTQLIRNAVYHGIEKPEDREPLGKDPEGEIRLSITHRNNQIFIKLVDNGGGIDFNKILKQATANKMIHNAAEAKDKNFLLKTIFMPGFSTIGDADLHAGRGIGLSLVKDRVKTLRGNISITTTPGKGTTFTIAIPMELQMAADNVS